MKNTSRGFAHILLILVVLLGVGALGYYAYTNKNNRENIQTNDLTWKVYSNDERHVSFQYPSDWNLKNYPFNNITISSRDYVMNPEDATAYKGSRLQFNILTDKDSSYFSTNKTPCIDCISQDNTSDNTNIIVQGFPAIRRVTNNYSGVQIEKDGQYYFISMSYKDPSVKQIFDQILSTFKFTN